MQLQINNTNLDLQPNQQLQIDYVFAALDMQNTEATQSRPFLLPPTVNNKKLLGNCHRPNIGTRQTSFDVNAFVGSEFMTKGTLRVNSIDKDGNFDCDITINEGTFWDIASKTKMTDLEYSEVVGMWEPLNPDPWKSVNDKLNSLIDQIYPETNYNFFPVKSEEFEWKTEENLDEGIEASPIDDSYINYFDPTIGEFIVNDWLGKTNQFVPFWSLSFVVKKTCSLLGYKVISDDVLAELSRVLIFNTGAMLPYVFVYYISFKQNLPDILISSFFQKLYKSFGIVILVNENKKTISIKLLKDILIDKSRNNLTSKLLSREKYEFKNNTGIQFTRSNIIENDISDKIVVTVDSSDHLPDLTSVEFKDKRYLVFDENKHYINSVDTLIAHDYIGLSQYIEGANTLVINVVETLQMVEDDIYSWIPNFEDKREASGKQLVDDLYCLLYHGLKPIRTSDTYPTYLRLIDAVGEPPDIVYIISEDKLYQITSDGWGEYSDPEFNKWHYSPIGSPYNFRKFRTMLSPQPDYGSQENTYSYKIYDNETTDYQLTMNDPKSFIQYFLSEFIEVFLNNNLFSTTYNIDLKPHEVKNFDHTVPVLIQSDEESLQAIFLPNKMSVLITGDKITGITLELDRIA